jgi:hypothetical protein
MDYKAASRSRSKTKGERQSMLRKLKTGRAALAAAALVALAALVVAPAASAHSGEYAEFNQCPSTNPKVVACLYNKTLSGEVVLGSKKVPIVNPVVLQGGISEPDANFFSTFYPALNGESLTKAAQPVPGGLSGLVNCKEISLGWLRASCEAIFENGLTGVNSTLELAKPASEIRVSLSNIIFGEGVGAKIPVKVHLENPLLGSGCYIGSSSEPIWWNLTTGKTSPPAPNKSITGAPGSAEFRGPDEGILRLNNNKQVDNSWSAPGASGCGGWPAEYILDPIINASVGVPAAAGKNTAILIGYADESPSEIVNMH